MEAATALVHQFYLTALERAADPFGLDHHVKILERANDPMAEAANMLACFRHCGEGSALRKMSPPLSIAPYREFISLGTNCYPAWLLKAQERKRASYPFDWIFSNSSMVLHCLRSDFAEFLVPEYFATSCGGVATDNLFYKERFDAGDVFAHRDPREAVHAAYYMRCVERWRAAVRANQRTLLFMLSVAPDEDVKTFPYIVGWLNRNFPAASLLMVSANRPTGDGVGSIGFRAGETIGSHRHLFYQPSSNREGMRFENTIDNLLFRALLMELPFSG
jgi:hypothetical protein